MKAPQSKTLVHGVTWHEYYSHGLSQPQDPVDTYNFQEVTGIPGCE